MGTHPNAILMAVLTPENTSRKIMKEIILDSTISKYDDTDILINGKPYHTLIMESDYDEGYQISANEGDLVFFDMVTYGYGDRISWDNLQIQKESLENWAKEMSNKFNCSYEIFISSNYW